MATILPMLFSGHAWINGTIPTFLLRSSFSTSLQVALTLTFFSRYSPSFRHDFFPRRHRSFRLLWSAGWPGMRTTTPWYRRLREALSEQVGLGWRYDGHGSLGQRYVCH